VVISIVSTRDQSVSARTAMISVSVGPERPQFLSDPQREKEQSPPSCREGDEKPPQDSHAPLLMGKPETNPFSLSFSYGRPPTQQRSLTLSPLPLLPTTPPKEVVSSRPEEGFFESLLQYASATKGCIQRGAMVPPKGAFTRAKNNQGGDPPETAAQEQASGQWRVAGTPTASPWTLLEIAHVQFDNGNFSEAVCEARRSLCSLVEEIRLDYDCLIRQAPNPRITTDRKRISLKEDVVKVYKVLLKAEVQCGGDPKGQERTHRIAVKVIYVKSSWGVIIPL